jgi:hypothetical protein
LFGEPSFHGRPKDGTDREESGEGFVLQIV